MYETAQNGLKKYDSKPRLYLLAGMAANQIGKSEEAIPLLKKGLVYISNDQKLLIDFYTQLAEAYHSNKQYKQSDYYFEKVLDIDSNNILVLNNYSYYLSLRNQDLEKALQMSKKTIEAEPRSSIYLDTYAWILYKLERYEKALEYIEKAIQHGGHDDSDVVEHYGDILYKTGNKEKALEQWKKAKTIGTPSAELIQKIENKTLGEKQ
jgi:tetratricopeptide (TPR) repeat protein